VALRRPSPAVNRCRRSVLQRYSTVQMLTTLDGREVIDPKAKYWSKIAIFAPVRGFSSEYCHNLWCGKTSCGYPMVKNLKICILVLTEYTNVTDTLTDRHTDKHILQIKTVRAHCCRRHTPHLCIASLGSKGLLRLWRIMWG